MKLSISNIAWGKADDAMMLDAIATSGYQGVEIAPTRVIEKNPYDHLSEAEAFAKQVKAKGLCVPSMQSIWYGRPERIFFDQTEREALTAYTKKAIDFAKTLGCENLVFGSPKNRTLEDETQREAGYNMFTQIADYAKGNDTVFSIEPNPTIYNTNFINHTAEAFELARRIDRKGFKVNVDVGTMIENGEDISVLESNMDLINHVHVSEPYLAVPQKQQLHLDLAAMLRANNYGRFVSVEMKNPGDIETVKKTMAYVKEVFG